MARFNLLPAKTGKENNTTGLPITSAGGILALAGLSGLHYALDSLSFKLLVSALPLLLAVLMVKFYKPKSSEDLSQPGTMTPASRQQTPGAVPAGGGR